MIYLLHKQSLIYKTKLFVFTLLMTTYCTKVICQDAAIGYDYVTASYYTQKLSISPITVNAGTNKECNFSISGVSSITTTRVCNVNVECYVFGNNNVYKEINLTSNSSPQTINSFYITGSTNNADTGKAAFVYSDQIPFNDASVIGAETVDVPASSGTYAIWRKINGTIPSGTKSIRIYRQIYFGSGSISTSAGNGRTLFGSITTLRLASIAVSNQTILPIKFIDASATFKENSVTINWSTISNDGSGTFEVQKSINNKDFESITTISNQKNKTNYSFVDNNVSLQNTIYYRIKAIDNKNEITYSKIIKIKINGQKLPTINVFPNPVVNNTISFEMKNQKQGIYEVSIMNNLGQVIYKNSFEHNGNNAEVRTIKVNNNCKGFVYLTIKSNQQSINEILFVPN